MTKSTEVKSITCPTNLFQRVHMDIYYGDCIALGGQRYVLILVDRETQYIWIYNMRELSEEDVTQYLQ